MVDCGGGGWSKKSSLIPLKLGTLVVHYIYMHNFRVLVKQLSYGIKFDFKFEIWEKFYKGFPSKKKNPWESEPRSKLNEILL